MLANFQRMCLSLFLAFSLEHVPIPLISGKLGAPVGKALLLRVDEVVEEFHRVTRLLQDCHVRNVFPESLGAFVPREV